MLRKDGVRQKKFIYGGKDIQLGWIYDSSKRDFYSPKVERSYKSLDERKYNFLIALKDYLNYKPLDYYKDKQWYKDFYNSPAKEIIRIQGKVDIERKASEAIIYEHGQTIVTSLMNTVDIVILVFLDKKLSRGHELIFDLTEFLNYIVEEKDKAFEFLPDWFKDSVITTNLYDGDKKIEIKNIAHSLKEGCRVLSTTFLKAKSAYVIDGHQQAEILNGNFLQHTLQKRKSNTAEAISESVKRNKEVTDNQPNVNSNFAIPPAVEYSQMTKSETNQMTESNASETQIDNVDFGKKVNTTTTEQLVSDNKEFNNTEKKLNDTKLNIGKAEKQEMDITEETTKEINGTESKAKKSSCVSQIQTKNKTTEKNTKSQTETDCEKLLRGLSESNKSKRVRRISQGRMDHKPCNVNESGSSTRGRSNSTKRTSVNSCGTQYATQEKPASIKKHQDVHQDKIKSSSKEKQNVNQNKGKNSLSDIAVEQRKQLNANGKETMRCQNVDSSTSNSENSKNHMPKNHISATRRKFNESAEIKENSCKDETIQSNSSLISTLPHSSNKPLNLFRDIEAKRSIIDMCGIKRKCYGKFSPDLDEKLLFPPDLEEKVVLLLGACGSGKTTLVNFVANYFEGVQNPDEIMVLVNPISKNSNKSLTKEITAYSFCSEREPDLVFTIIDTPGLNDSSGAEVRDHVLALKTFLANMNANNMKLHALGFVAQAHLVRLTSSERLVLDYVSTLFGEKVNENIITFITFADNQQNPPVVEAVQYYGLKTKHFLKFSNAILSTNAFEVDELDRVYWRIGYKSMKKVIMIIKDMPPLSANAMNALQKEVYSKTVVDGAMKNLEAEISSFVDIVMKERSRKHINNKSSHVWDLATAAYIQIKQSNNSYASVENLVKEVTSDVCHKKSINAHECLKYLTFAPNRGMRPAAFATIYSLNTVYIEKKKIYTDGKNRTNTGKKSKSTNIVKKYCYECNDRHLMDIKYGYGVPGYRTPTLVCKECICPDSFHGIEPETISYNEILDHVRNDLCNIIQRYSIPGVSITDNDVLQFLMEEMTDQYKEFINDLLNMKNIV